MLFITLYYKNQVFFYSSFSGNMIMFDWESGINFAPKIDEIRFKILFNRNVSSIIKALLFTRFCENIFINSALRNCFFITMSSILFSILYFNKIWLYAFIIFYYFVSLITINSAVSCVIINSMILIILIVILFS